jgi:hypothetical protein
MRHFKQARTAHRGVAYIQQTDWQATLVNPFGIRGIGISGAEVESALPGRELEGGYECFSNLDRR